MTDTTDTAALHAALCKLISLEGVRTLAAELIDQLEAARQLADELVIIDGLREVHTRWVEKRLAKAEAEIAELKAKLANPVVLHNERFDYQDTDEYEVGYVRGFNASRLESIADIEKAGFTVKGE